MSSCRGLVCQLPIQWDISVGFGADDPSLPSLLGQVTGRAVHETSIMVCARRFVTCSLKTFFLGTFGLNCFVKIFFIDYVSV